jgi:transcriptional regulator GlxA family with amidase domain
MSNETLAPPTATYNGEAIQKVQDRRIRAVFVLIQNDPTYSVAELASKVDLSRRQLQRLFKLQTGAHIGNFLAELKLQSAAKLLLFSALSIKEIAHKLGYEHQSSFTRAFVNRFAQPPKSYRQKSDGGEC